MSLIHGGRNARLKDSILERVNFDKKGVKTDVYSIADESKQDVNLITYLAEELERDGHVKLMLVTIKGGTAVPNEYLLQPTNRGVYFLKFDGGYTRVYRRDRLKSIWNGIKGTAAFFNTVVVLAFAGYGIYLTDKTNKLEEENARLRLNKIKEIINNATTADSLLRKLTK